MPLHRLNEKPTRLGHFADLTCDCDGRLSRLISDGHSKPLLELHALRPNKPCLIGMFLGGAYQEVMGNLHNLFGSTDAVQIRLAAGGDYQVDHVVRGDTNGNVFQAMEHVPDLLLERLPVASEQAISNGQLRIGEARRLMDHLESSMRQSTYLQS
jgi:arginine decarboxylase